MKNKAENFISISKKALAEEIITPDDFAQLQADLYRLLATQSERYTMGESSSIRVETADALYRSILFSLQLYFNATGQNITLIKKEPLEHILRASWKEIESQIAFGQHLLLQVTETAPSIENISYWDTLTEIKQCFSRYDYRFFAHVIPCSIDYQLAHPVSEQLEGIEYVNDYLRRLLIENELCRHFETNQIRLLLEHYCPDYRGLLINLFEPVAVNALGLTLLCKSPYPLHVSMEDELELRLLFQDKSQKYAAELLTNAADRLCERLSMCDLDTVEYIKSTALDLYPRIKAALPSGNLGFIFFSIR